SYTIGEGVLLSESFPYQTVQLLRQTAAGGWQFTAPEIIAKTGWTTDELNAAIQETTLLAQYDIVSLLIGVNNQYRGRSAAEFKDEFTQLLQKAIAFAGNNPAKVFVLSIPDWGVTPFAEARLPDGQGRDREQIAKEIDAFNDVYKNVSADLQSTYIDITESQRADGTDPEFLAVDGLHPSGKEYAKWAEKLQNAIHIKLL
ncbi:MAG TPA: SGNH/GDSL hydrolase family protein, partial [Ferruginibacter sp.]|nr:SGNH/GDSL hydrolase family protein [Ferruginibacter sp.]